jgi:sigma-B regulation protein RsbU (phosphoserine phosphatase)
MTRSATRARNSLRLRLLVATVALVAVALGVSVVLFERVARSVIVGAVHSHLAARATEVQSAVERFQAERAFTVRAWAEVDAMQLSLDTLDPKFAEDYLRRVIQDQGGAIAGAALVDPDGIIVSAVRVGTAHERRGVPVVLRRGERLDLPVVKEALAGKDSAGVAPLAVIVPNAGLSRTVLVAAPIKDFAGDLCGAVVGALSPQALSALIHDVNGTGHYRPAVADATGELILSLPGAKPGALQSLFAAQGSPGALEEVVGADGEPALAVRTATGERSPGWQALMLLPRSEAFDGLYWLRAVLGVLFAAVLVIAVVASIGALKQATRPLFDVTSSMARVAEGDLSIRLPDVYADELGDLVKSFNTMVAEVARSRDELQRTEALRREVEIAHRIQTAILPISPAVKGFEIAARMKPADDVGGDLYDILAFDDDTFWVLVGDVSGHGINSGLVMMMAQAAAYGAIADDPRCAPADVISAVNRVVHENVRRRMGRDDYLTLMAARHLGDGRFVAAGAHQPIFIARAGGVVDVVDPAGPWCGLGPSVRPTEYEFRVGPGETLCLITDGVVEAPGDHGDLFGEDRLCELLSASPLGSAPETLATIFSRVEAFASMQNDDMTAVVLRRKA